MEESVDRKNIVAVKRILMPVDKSQSKEKIAAYVISLGKARGAEIIAINIIKVWHGLWAGHAAENLQELERQAEDFLNEIIHLSNKGVSIKTKVIKVESIEIGKSIIDYAKDNKMDVIAIGAKGMTTEIKEFFPGSVAGYVIRHAHCPVFAIR